MKTPLCHCAAAHRLHNSERCQWHVLQKWHVLQDNDALYLFGDDDENYQEPSAAGAATTQGRSAFYTSPGCFCRTHVAICDAT